MRGIIFENVLSGGQGCLWLNMHGIKSARIMFADVSSEGRSATASSSNVEVWCEVWTGEGQ